MLVPRPVGWGGNLTDSGSTIGDEKQRPVPRLSYHASGAPPPMSQRIIIPGITIRRIYNKTTILHTRYVVLTSDVTGTKYRFCNNFSVICFCKTFLLNVFCVEYLTRYTRAGRRVYDVACGAEETNHFHRPDSQPDSQLTWS